MRSFKIVFVAAIISLCFVTVSSFGADVAKIGVVNFQRIFDASNAGKQASAEINKQGKKMESDLNENGKEIEEIRKKLEREALVMSKEMREEKEREFRIKVNDLKVLKNKYEKNLREVQKRLIKRIRKEVLDIVEEIGKKEGYLLIIENIGVLYSPNTLDITDKIIEKYNANFVEGAEKKTEPGKTE